MNQHRVPRSHLERKLAKVLRDSALCKMIDEPVKKESPLKLPQDQTFSRTLYQAVKREVPTMSKTRLNFSKISKAYDAHHRLEPLRTPDDLGFLCSRKL